MTKESNLKSKKQRLNEIVKQKNELIKMLTGGDQKDESAKDPYLFILKIV